MTALDSLQQYFKVPGEEKSEGLKTYNCKGKLRYLIAAIDPKTNDWKMPIECVMMFEILFDAVNYDAKTGLISFINKYTGERFMFDFNLIDDYNLQNDVWLCTLYLSHDTEKLRSQLEIYPPDIPDI